MSLMPLHNYQIQAIQHIQNNPRCAVFASMGSGKTRICLEAITEFPVLVIAPLRVARDVWPVEAKKWKPSLKCVNVSGIPAKRLQILNSHADIFTINFENLVWLETTKLAAKFKTIIVDESSKLRSFRIQGGTKNTKALKKMDQADRFIELTGTPAPQGLTDLYGQLHFLDGGYRLGRTWNAFTSRFFSSVLMPGGYIKLTPYSNSFNLVTSLIKDLCLTIDVKDHMQIDEPLIRNVSVELPKKALVQYKELEREMVMELEDRAITAATAAIASMKCLQLSSGFIYDEGEVIDIHDEKLQALDEILEEWSGHPVIVVYWFKATLERLKKRYPKGEELKDSKRWNEGEIPILFIHPASAGHGLNLAEGGNVMVFVDLNWNLELYLQVIERIGPTRQKQAGLNRAVHIYRIVADNTVDLRVLKVLNGKENVQQALLGDLK